MYSLIIGAGVKSNTFSVRGVEMCVCVPLAKFESQIYLSLLIGFIEISWNIFFFNFFSTKRRNLILKKVQSFYLYVYNKIKASSSRCRSCLFYYLRRWFPTKTVHLKLFFFLLLLLKIWLMRSLSYAGFRVCSPLNSAPCFVTDSFRLENSHLMFLMYYWVPMRTEL